MTEPRTYSSPAGRIDRRAEFIAFYEGTYSAVTGEMLALTGDLDAAEAVADASYARTWQAWPAVRNLDWPVMWVRADAVRRTRRPPRRMQLLQHGLPALPAVDLDPEDEVLVAGLQSLPPEHRLPLVLHYLGHVPVETITEWFGDPVADLEVRLDAGFDALVAILDWPDDADEDTDAQDDDAQDDDAQDDDADGVPAYREVAEGSPYDWTAEALESCAQRFRHAFPVPSPALVFRRATVKKVTHRGAPITAAAVAAAVGLVVYLSPTPHSTAQAAGYAVPPSSAAAAAAPAGLDTVTADTATPEPTTARTAMLAGTTTKGTVLRATTKKAASESTAVADVPALAVSSAPATPTSTTTSTTTTSTTPTTTAAVTGGETGSTGGETGGSAGTGSLAGSASSGTDSTGSSVPVATTDSTTPTTDSTTPTTDETASATTTRDHDQDDCPPTTTATATTSTETTMTDPGTSETTTTEAQPVVSTLINETNTMTATAGAATGRSVRSATGQASE